MRISLIGSYGADVSRENVRPSVFLALVDYQCFGSPWVLQSLKQDSLFYTGLILHLFCCILALSVNGNVTCEPHSLSFKLIYWLYMQIMHAVFLTECMNKSKCVKFLQINLYFLFVSIFGTISMFPPDLCRSIFVFVLVSFCLLEWADHSFSYIILCLLFTQNFQLFCRAVYKK